ncbi:MAG: SUF system Fe-S cluster assembly protein [Geminicoccaceae bacterium]|nr:SUF system Fe-S cluster assembly protein [Geminicoccaceae bacterium]
MQAPDEAQDEALKNAADFLDQKDEAAPDPERLAEVGRLGDAIVEQLKTVFDPEIPVDIYELGLIYKIDVHDDNGVTVQMTLTSPHCPVAESLPLEVQHKVGAVEGVTSAEVEISWDPPWHPSMMSEDAQLELGMIY